MTKKSSDFGNIRTKLLIKTIKQMAMSQKVAKEEEDQDKKYPFTSTITAENKRRLFNYQSNKPGGARTTDVINQAFKLFFDTHKQYADGEPAKPARK
ncbi:hypothetical protein HNQ93_004221 [Hymenobacter luteus]|uniref:Uncharacterized protein n=2 Tax=Hymenobacter TaxID=89966 RepID=A0A7W9WF31_9BACT|nr:MULTISPECIES: hypothetical protein [Hymenobacter]MBB4603594.1 hypothetical protein [Hymenobacter latericoloratus]MBB6061342.1 hypothetical protein [Hymenobacter luteus]